MRRAAATLCPLAILLGAMLAQARAAEAMARSLAEVACAVVFEPADADDTPGMDIPDVIASAPVNLPAASLSLAFVHRFVPVDRPDVGPPMGFLVDGPLPPPCSSSRLARLQSFRC